MRFKQEYVILLSLKQLAPKLALKTWLLSFWSIFLFNFAIFMSSFWFFFFFFALTFCFILAKLYNMINKATHILFAVGHHVFWTSFENDSNSALLLWKFDDQPVIYGFSFARL